MDDRTFDTWAEAEAYLMADGDLACFSRYGSRTSDCAPLAFALALIYADSSGDPITADDLDGAMSLVVNGHDDVLDLLKDRLYLLKAEGEVLLAVVETIAEEARQEVEDRESDLEGRVFDLDCQVETLEAELAEARELAQVVLDVERGIRTYTELQRLASAVAA